MVQDRNIGVLSFSMASDESLEKFANRIKGFEDKFGIVFNDKRVLLEALDHRAVNSDKKNICCDVKEDYTYSDFAVLLRNSDEFGFIYQQIFNYLGIPNIVEDSVNTSCLKEIKYLLLYLKSLNNPNNKNSLRKKQSIPKP